jgi:hypothetical protein
MNKVSWYGLILVTVAASVMPFVVGCNHRMPSQISYPVITHWGATSWVLEGDKSRADDITLAVSIDLVATRTQSVVRFLLEKTEYGVCRSQIIERPRVEKAATELGKGVGAFAADSVGVVFAIARYDKLVGSCKLGKLSQNVVTAPYYQKVTEGDELSRFGFWRLMVQESDLHRFPALRPPLNIGTRSILFLNEGDIAGLRVGAILDIEKRNIAGVALEDIGLEKNLPVFEHKDEQPSVSTSFSPRLLHLDSIDFEFRNRKCNIFWSFYPKIVRYQNRQSTAGQKESLEVEDGFVREAFELEGRGEYLERCKQEYGEQWP